MSYFDRIERGVVKLASGLAIVGGLGLIFATLTTCASILMKLIRRVFDSALGPEFMLENAPWLRPILGEEELVTYGVGFALFAALPWVMVRRGHIRVDLFDALFGARFNRLLDLLSDLCLAALAYLIMTRQWLLIFKPARGSQPELSELLLGGDWSAVWGRVRARQESQILEIPLWPTYVVAELCVVIFFIVACFCVWRSARELFPRRSTGA